MQYYDYTHMRCSNGTAANKCSGSNQPFTINQELQLLLEVVVHGTSLVQAPEIRSVQYTSYAGCVDKTCPVACNDNVPVLFTIPLKTQCSKLPLSRVACKDVVGQ